MLDSASPALTNHTRAIGGDCAHRMARDISDLSTLSSVHCYVMGAKSSAQLQKPYYIIIIHEACSVTNRLATPSASPPITLKLARFRSPHVVVGINAHAHARFSKMADEGISATERFQRNPHKFLIFIAR